MEAQRHDGTEKYSVTLRDFLCGFISYRPVSQCETGFNLSHKIIGLFKF